MELDSYINPQIQVEHILPQTPTQAVVADFDDVEAIEVHIRRFGNLTLLEKSINASIGNGLFANKQSAYRQSRILLTKSLGGRVSVGKATAIDRVGKDLDEFHSWRTTDIERRQRMLITLSRATWDMPEAEEESVLEG